MDLIQIADAEIVRREAELDELRRDRNLLFHTKGAFPNAPGDDKIVASYAAAGGARDPMPGRKSVETEAECEATIAEKPASKPRAPRGSGMSVAARVLKWLSGSSVGHNVGEITWGIGDRGNPVNARAVSQALQVLKKAGKVRCCGLGNTEWFITASEVAAGMAATDAREMTPMAETCSTIDGEELARRQAAADTGERDAA